MISRILLLFFLCGARLSSPAPSPASDCPLCVMTGVCGCGPLHEVICCDGTHAYGCRC